MLLSLLKASSPQLKIRASIKVNSLIKITYLVKIEALVKIKTSSFIPQVTILFQFFQLDSLLFVVPDFSLPLATKHPYQ